MDEVADRRRARMVVSDDGNALSIRLSGELDIASLPEVQAELDELLRRESQPLQVDLADLGFLDSSGLAVLIRLANHFGPVRVVHATVPVRRVIETLGLADRFGLDGA